MNITQTGLFLSVILIPYSAFPASSSNIEFDTAFLSQVNTGVDLSRFSHAGYIIPGTYDLILNINDRPLEKVSFEVQESDKNGDVQSTPCITTDVLTKLRLNQAAIKKTTLLPLSQCVDFSLLDGIRFELDLTDTRLNILIPQGYLEYSDPYWDPPSRWDEGIAGMILDYNASFGMNDYASSPGVDKTLSSYGIVGANLGSWRIRSDWQGNWIKRAHADSSHDVAITRLYAYRALPDLQAQLLFGENYLQSSIFSGFKYLGAGLSSDERMLPPNARSYSPEVVGVARTDAKVIISQDGRILHEERVIAGPFRIQNITASVKGILDVRVEEQDGQIQTFQVNTINAPYLSRPGQIRYNIASGRPMTFNHKVDGPAFISGDMSFGAARDFSLLGGTQLTQYYQSAMLGTGYDFLSYGAISLQHYQSWASLDEEHLTGSSYTINYSKDFTNINSSLALASYRFSNRNYLTLSDYFSVHTSDASSHQTGNSARDSFTASFNTNYGGIGASSYVSLDKTNYRDGHYTSRYNLALSKGWSTDSIKGLNTTLSFYKTTTDSSHQTDSGGYLSLSIPFDHGYLSYSGSLSQQGISHSIGYSQPLGETGSMNINSSMRGRQSPSFGGGYTYRGDTFDLMTNMGHLSDSYTDVNVTVRGGGTITHAGAGIHNVSQLGGTRMLIDANDIPDIKIRSGGRTATTNNLGIAVTTGSSPYVRQRTEVDLNDLPNEANISYSIGEHTLTEGAIGYWALGVRRGKQVMARINTPDGYPPFGVSVINNVGIEIGIVTDEGMAYISGVDANETVHVQWGDNKQCQLHLPDSSEQGEMVNLICS